MNKAGKVVNVVVGIVVLGVVLLLGLVLAIVSQPDDRVVERKRVVRAAPEVVWPEVADLRAFVVWSPWSDLDPDQEVVFSEVSQGVGAWYTWKGDEAVGSGRMAITAAEPPFRVVEDLEFREPFESRAEVTMTLRPVEGGTEVSWKMASTNNFMGKAFGLLMDMDAMLGADFDKGLSRLAARVEAR
jgi:hypothetical protein